MKKIIFILIFSSLFACNNIESKSYYPANPPADLKIIPLTSENHGGAYVGDYLLLFRSENRKNTRFGGFLIFINSSEELLQEILPDDASYELGLVAGENSSDYNPTSGIDVQLVVLFTDDNEAAIGDIITVDSDNYSVTAVRRKNYFASGSWLTMRSYLWDEEKAEILQVSDTGNTVQIP